MEKDFYEILGIPSNATQQEIKSAYRRLAKELHPDYYGDNCAPFRDLQEAYAILADPQTRKKYDDACAQKRRQHQVSRSHNFSRSVPIEPLIPEQEAYRDFTPPKREAFGSFENIFDQLWQNLMGFTSHHTIQAQTWHIDLPVSIQLAQRGGDVPLRIPFLQECPVCDGQGHQLFFACQQCNGQGTIQSELPLTISLPAGIKNNEQMKITLNHFGNRSIDLILHFKITDSY